MEWLQAAEQALSLIVALLGLLGTIISTLFAIKANIEKNKVKTLTEIWSLIMALTDEAMKIAEASGKKGEEKKQMVMYAVVSAAKASNINLVPFTKQLSEYIDQTILFVREMKKNEVL